jgi:hypothetical protein
MKNCYAYLLFYVLVAYSLIANLQPTYQILDEGVEVGVRYYLTFYIIYIHYDPPFTYVYINYYEGKIRFNGTEYSSGEYTIYVTGRYPLEAVLDQRYKLLEWESPENIIIEDRFSPNTYAILLTPRGIVPTIVPTEIVSTIVMYITDNDVSSSQETTTYSGNLTKNSLQIVNKINNNPNVKFVPYESIKINNIVEVNEGKPYINKPIYNGKTQIFINNTILVNDLLIKREGTNIYKIKYLNYIFSEQFNELIDVRKTYSIVYPESNYGLGISDLFGKFSITTITTVKIKWSWYELSNNGYVYKEKIINLYGSNTTSLFISNLLIELVGVNHTQNDINLDFQLIWSDDLSPVLFKENVFSLNFIDLGKSLGNSDSSGRIKVTLNYESINNLEKISGYLKVKAQFKGNGTLYKSNEFLVKWVKLATLIKEKSLSNNKLKLKIKVVEFENFTGIKNALVLLFVDNKLVTYNVTDSNGETIFNVDIQENYKKIYIKVIPSYFKTILLPSQLSDLIIDVKI